MLEISEVLQWLRTEGLLQASLGPQAGALESIRKLRDAGPGSLSWLSPRYLSEVSLFAGSMLIGPPVEDCPLTFTYAVTPSPKLAFSRVVERFFPELTEITWTGPLAPDARMGKGVRLAPGCVIGPGVELADDVSLGPNSVLAHCTVGARTKVGANCTIGLPGFGYEKDAEGRHFRFPHLGRVRIGCDVEIGSNTCIDRGGLGDTVIGDGCKIDNLVHVAHNVEMGDDCMVIAHAMVAGSVRLGRGVWVAPSAAVKNQLEIGAGALIGLGAVVLKPVAEGQVMVGNPARALDK